MHWPGLVSCLPCAALRIFEGWAFACDNLVATLAVLWVVFVQSQSLPCVWLMSGCLCRRSRSCHTLGLCKALLGAVLCVAAMRLHVMLPSAECGGVVCWFVVGSACCIMAMIASGS